MKRLIILKILAVEAGICIFWRLLFMMKKGNIIAAIETLQDVSREEELTKSLSEYAETLQNELVENIELRRQIEDLYNYLQSIVNSLPDKIYEIG
ncbi:MAG: hypothetical protein MZV70_27295 [Desulfobacterales bacterium]|nr:hypothetical protein [Desulfobacterales bacterium]